ncbi:MAG: WD40 repeat domain-containing protein [Promethearchaeota archaeon]
MLNKDNSDIYRRLKGHNDEINTLTISPEGKYIISGSEDKTIKIWDTESGRLIKTLKGHKDAVKSVAISPDGRYIVSVSDKTIKIWNLFSGILINSIIIPEIQLVIGGLSSIIMTPDGEYLISGSWDKTLEIRALKSGMKVNSLVGHQDGISSVALTPEGKYIISGSGDKTIKIWDFKTGLLYNSLEGHKDCVSSVALTPDGKYIISGSWDRTIKIWDFETGKMINSLEGHKDVVSSVIITSGGNYIISGFWDKTVKVWDFKTGEIIKSFQGHRLGVNSVALTPDGKYLLSAAQDKTIIIWNLDIKEEQKDENTEKIIKILEFQLENDRLPTKMELLKEFSFSFEEIEHYLDILKKPIKKWKSISITNIKQKAEKILKELEKPNLLELMVKFGLSFQEARSMGKFLIDNGWIEDFPLVYKKIRKKQELITTSEPENIALKSR